MTAEIGQEHAVAKLADIPPGTALRVDVDGIDVAVVHTEGHVFAIDDICSHAEVSLSEGEVEGCFIECWLHGSRFDLRTGEPTGPPAVEPVPVYTARVEGTGADATIYVSVTQGAGHTWQN
ncbi:MAG: non-heme iron oxygenase ferredoxin subunit [Candidatus Nanopelagicales bacterium]